jgi:subtilase family serine protease
VLVYDSTLGGTFIVGGTSAGSPQWAAIFALVNQARAAHSKGPLGFANTLLYTAVNHAADFHDITVGNNQLVGTPVGFSATAGWDDATGWGTPNVTNLISDLS